MKIGIISDIHGNIHGLNAVLNNLGDVDLLLCAGDISGYYYQVNAVFETLCNYRFTFILGNHDLYLLKFLGYNHIPQLMPYYKTMISRTAYNTKYGLGLEVVGNNIKASYARLLTEAKLEETLIVEDHIIKMFHGSPWNPAEEYIYPEYKSWSKFAQIEADIIILGHTHIPFIKQVSGKIVINPGSCGQPRDYDPRASYIKIDTSSWETVIERVEYNVSNLIEEIDKFEPHNEKIKNILIRTKFN